MEKVFPKGWVETEFTNLIAHVLGGDWGKDVDFEDENYVEVYCIRGSEIKNWSTHFGDTAVVRKIKKSSLDSRRLINGDILLEISGGGPDQPVGRVVLITENTFDRLPELPLVCTNFLRLIRPVSQINSSYFCSYLDFFYYSGEVVKYQGGSNNLRNLKYKEYETIQIPLPPLAEQERIVVKLDKLFAQHEKIKAALDRIPQLLKNFRQQVLTHAVTGKLTEQWREGNDLMDIDVYYNQITLDLENHYNDKLELAKRNKLTKPKDQKKNKKSEKGNIILPELPNNWRYYRCEDICYLVTDGAHHRPTYIDQGIKFLSVKNVRPFTINDTDTKYISPEEHSKLITRCNPEAGDILYTKIGATYGYASVIELNYEFSIFVSLALIKPSRKILSKYLEIAFNSGLVFNQAHFKVSGIGVPDLHLIEIRDFAIPLTPLQEQEEIVRRVESLFAKADIIEARYQTLKAKIDCLPQAILNKAFKGELVPQLPTDGDAKDLLAEIMALKKEIAGKKKQK
ncbi:MULTISPECIES: restriction endonuclease subunit S [Sphingobacterium]|uniref:restriction endonuclease subunit S n=1 Tax=Sphingobacterium TaxID=28453 RepID=UPI0013D90A8F|nr:MULTISPECIES: restriction endonuclease subunit S [unclassified Sphingobacterium]